MTAARGPGSVILPCSTVKTSVESAPANAGLCALEEVERLLGLGARDVEVVGRLAARAGGGTEQHDDDDRAGQAALPVVGEGAGDPREQ